MRRMRVVMILSIVLCTAGVAMGQTEWVEYENNPLIEPGAVESWSSFGLHVLEVVYDGELYHMYFAGGEVEYPPAAWEIGHATSSDGIEWEMDPANPVLRLGEVGEWDSGWLSGVAVIREGSGFRMWYGGAVSASLPASVGYATSLDGSTWTKYAGNPILGPGLAGSFDGGGLWPDTVLFDGVRYKMWYSASGASGATGVDFSAGYAESTDGLAWTRYAQPILETGRGWDSFLVQAPAVTFDGNRYHMWYAGTDGSGRYGIGYAVSGNGITWAKHLANPVLGYFDATLAYLYPQVLSAQGGAQTDYRLWYSIYDWDTDLASTNYATSTCCKGMAHVSLIPAAALSAGAQGSFFQTDLELSNADTTAEEYQLYWIPRGRGVNSVGSDRFTLAAGMSARYSNVLAEVFDLEPDMVGALVIVSTSPHVLAMSRTYNVPANEPPCTYGQAMAAVTEDRLIRYGERRRILFATEHAEMRTNVGCTNGGPGSVLVNLELFDMQGTSLATDMMLLQGWGNDQINRIFQDFRPVTGYVEVWTDVPSGVFYCYGSVLDNVTSDPTTIPPQ